MSAAGKKLESQFICTGSGGPVQHGEPPRMTMIVRKIRKPPGNKGSEQGEAQGLARCGLLSGTVERREAVGATSPSSSDCCKSKIRMGTWNVRGLNQVGKMANVLQEMKRMNIDVLGVSETFWKGEGEFMTGLPETEENFRVIFSGGDKNRRGVGMVLRGKVGQAVMQYNLISDRIIVVRLKATPVNLLLLQVYAPCEDGEEDEKELFYETLDKTVSEYKKGRECLIVMGDFNGKVGKNKEEDTVGPFGVGVRNENGQYLVDFCKRHNLHVTNTWFQQKQSAQHTWTSPDGNTKNQIDYILSEKRFRNGVQNSKSMPGADCGSDRNPVVSTMQIRLKGLKRSKRAAKWNIRVLQNPNIRNEYQMKLDKKLQDKKVSELDEIDEIWDKLKESIGDIADEICGKEDFQKKQNWMNANILNVMEQRRKYKMQNTDECQKKYKELKNLVQRLCREAKDKYFEDKCKEIEVLDKMHSQLLFKKVKDLQPRGNRVQQVIKDKAGKSIMEKEDILKRWAEYVEELYEDKKRGEADMGDLVNEVYEISSEEIRNVINELPKEKACGEDNISAELLQCMGEEGIEIISKLINMIYKSGYIPEDFRKSIFVPLPKFNKTQDCGDFRTIALISHASKILLHLIKRRITPIIERQLGDSQMGFRKGKGTRDAIFQLRLISERSLQVDKKVYMCFVDYQKAFDRVNHDKLLEVMEKAGIPELEQRLIINLYWHQQAAVRWDNDISRYVSIRKGVRQGCIISLILFNLYSEFMIIEALESEKGIRFSGSKLTNLRYADDAVLVAETKKALQRMMDKLNEACKVYGMAINVKKTKVMVVCRTGKVKCSIVLDNVILEQVDRYKYLGSWICEDARCDEEIKARIGMAKAAFWQNKELMRRNIRFKTKKKMLDCYVFSVLNYGCESWTWNKATCKKVNAFEMWCYRRILKISFVDRITNKEVLNRVQTDLHFMKDMKRRKLEYAGHVMRGSSGLTHVTILEGKVCGKRPKGRPRLTWMDDIIQWTGLETYEKVKRVTEDRAKWKTIVVNLLAEDDK